MMRMLAAFFLIAVLPGSLPARADVTSQQYRAVVDATLEHYLRPGFTALEDHTADLSREARALCAQPGRSRLDAVRVEFAEVLASWSRVEFARLGPVIEEKRLERFSFWPDPKGIGLRQVRAVLAGKDESVISADTLKAKSVALQGLQALEFLLFGTGAETLETSDPFRCAYASAIAENLHAIAGEIASGWRDEDGYAGLMRETGPDNPVYLEAHESVADILEVITTGLQFVRDVKIGNFLGETVSKSKPRQAAFWRSGETFANIRENLAGLEQLFVRSGLADLLASQPGGAGIRQSIDFEFRNAFANLDRGYPPIEEAVRSERDHARLAYLKIVTNSLWIFFSENAAGLLGLRMGFNALDGD